jgi:hypothetical protein
MVLMLMAGWAAAMTDVKGAFLIGEFENGEEMYAQVPQGFEHKWDPNIFVLFLLRTVYGTKQTAAMFWKQLLQAMQSMKFEKSKVDPCLYYKWGSKMGLILWLS